MAFYKFTQTGVEVQSIFNDIQKIQNDTSHTATDIGIVGSWIKYFLDNKANLNGGNTFEGNQIFTNTSSSYLLKLDTSGLRWLNAHNIPFISFDCVSASGCLRITNAGYSTSSESDLRYTKLWNNRIETSWNGSPWSNTLNFPEFLTTKGTSSVTKTLATTDQIPTESTVSGWGFTKNTGTITGIKMNGSSKGTSGVVDLGTVITSHQDISGKVDDYTISLYNGQSGNPRPVKFLTINYNGTDSNNAAFIDLKAISCHGNGASYQFKEEIVIGVSYTGVVTVNNLQSLRTTCGTYDGVEHFYGDIFYTINTTNKIVDFFILGGQYATQQFTPYKRRNGASAGTITQYSGTSTYYSSGTKVYGNNGLISTKNDLGTQVTYSYSSGTLTITTK